MHIISSAISAKGSWAEAVILEVLQQRKDHLWWEQKLRRGTDGPMRVLRSGGGLHGRLHPPRPRGALRELGVWPLCGGRRRAAAPRAGRRHGGGAAVAHGSVQGLQHYHKAEPEALPRRLHEGHRQKEFQPAGGVHTHVPRRAPHWEGHQLPASLLCVIGWSRTNLYYAFWVVKLPLSCICTFCTFSLVNLFSSNFVFVFDKVF